MFDLTSSKLLILGLVALIVVGPKDLPLLLRTIGKYVGRIRRHANEFRAQFDEAMRDQELANLKSEMEAVKRDVQATVHSATSGVRDDLAVTTRELDQKIKAPPSGSLGSEHSYALGVAAPNDGHAEIVPPVETDILGGHPPTSTPPSAPSTFNGAPTSKIGA